MGQRNPEEPDSAPDASRDPGDSITRRGEDIQEGSVKEPGRHDAGTQGPTDRPVGTSTMRDSTGISPQEPIDTDSPTLPSGGN